MSTKSFLLATAVYALAFGLSIARAEDHGRNEERAAEAEHGEAASDGGDAFLVKVRDTGPEFQIPAKLWDLLLGGASEGEKSGGGGGHGGGGKKEETGAELATASFLYSAVQVELKEKNAGVLTHPKIIFKLPEGGSEIDLAKWTTGKPGTFSVNFTVEGASAKDGEAKVFFYSRARKRRIGDQIVGAGCRQFMELSSFLLDPKRPDALMVNTTRNFHDSVLGGHFLFTWTAGGNRRVTRVSFNDTANPQYFCGKEK